ncbi:MAG: hypothetical protein ACJAT2_001763 [Bacteriovoracaceae bacterium]|jgi:hypothetical protein
MSSLFLPPPGFLFASLLFNSELINQEEAVGLWESQWGEAEIFKPSHNPMIEYYSKEMGPKESLQRLLVVSKKLYDREVLVEAKLWGVEQEDKREGDGRHINIDPGLMTLENIILGTGKIYGHRPYLGKGVYADLNLLYISGTYSPLEWTYPDYKENEVISFFNHTRIELHESLKLQKLDSYNTRR